MNKVLYIILISIFSLTIISCGEKEEHTNTNDNTNSTTNDTTAPLLLEETAVTTPTNDTTPNYKFYTTEAGTITYGGSCSSGTTTATIGNNTITFNTLSEGTYSDCTITVTDSAGNVSNSLTITSFIVDSTAATLAEVTAVTTPTNDSTPNYTFSSSEAGTISYGGSCSSSTTSATTDNNTITLVSLSDGTYSNCTITVTDNVSNSSVTLNISSFVVDTTAPTVSSISTTADNQSSVSITDNITVTFSEAMDTTYVTTNTDNTSCSGTLRVSSDNFSNCVQMASSPSSSNSNMTWTLDPYDNLTAGDTYTIRVTTGVKDAAGNAMSSQYETGSAFTTSAQWVMQAYIKAVNNDGGDWFGIYGATVDGDTITVGSPREKSNQTTITNGTTASSNNSNDRSGAAYVYKRTGTSWAQEAYIKAVNNNSSIRASFGYAGARISGDTLAVGAMDESSNQKTITNGTTASSNTSGSYSGAAYVYKRSGTSWVQEAYIKASNADSGDGLGSAIALDGDTLAVWATKEKSNQTTITNGTGSSSDNSFTRSGAVYVYKRTGTTWAQEAYIKAANNDANDEFGQPNLDGDTLAIAVRYEDSNQTTITNGTSASSNNSSENSGAVYVYKRTGSTWAQEAYIKPSNSDAGDGFGGSVSISGNLMAVGATGEDSNQVTITNGSTASSNNDTSNSGAVYIFERTGTSWAQVAYIKAPNPDVDDNFGVSVSLDNKTLLVTSWAEDSNQTTITNGTTASANNSNAGSGAAYVFVLQ